MDKEIDLKMEVIKWGDAESIDQWESIKDIEPDFVPIIYSVGFILKETKHVIVMALNFDKANDKASCIMLIPKQMIINRSEVDRVKTTKSSPKSARRKR